MTGLELRKPLASASRRGPARRSANFLYVHGQLAGEVQSANGTRGAAALKKRLPLRARAGAQLAPVHAIETAAQ
ncbi:MAG: hypothetical protein KGJ68_13300, partial [Gammaproteobacteria bacterium]|nr:hypothetical protein [Gammaproteobacteria bacterium]